MARPPLLGKEGKAPRLSTSRFIHVFSPCSKNSLVLIFLLQASRDRSGNPVFDHFRRRKSFVSDDEFLKIGLSGSISSVVNLGKRMAEVDLHGHTVDEALRIFIEVYN